LTAKTNTIKGRVIYVMRGFKARKGNIEEIKLGYMEKFGN